jgi:hypothetical protein
MRPFDVTRLARARRAALQHPFAVPTRRLAGHRPDRAHGQVDWDIPTYLRRRRAGGPGGPR